MTLWDSMSPSILTEANISPSYTRIIARALKLQESDLPDLLSMTQLTTEQLHQDETFLTAVQQIQVFRNALRITCDEDFSLRVGKMLTASTHGVLGFLMHTSPNFFSTIQAIQSYMPTHMSFAHIDVRDCDDNFEIYGRIDVDMEPAILRCFVEAFGTVLFDCAEFIIGRPLRETKIHLTYERPSYGHLYPEFFPGEIYFNEPNIKLVVPKELCYLPNASSNPEGYLFAIEQCEKLKAELITDKKSTKYQIQKLILGSPQNPHSEDEVAASLFVSKRTMARRLKNEGTSFRQIREELLSQQAAEYLRNSNMSIDAIAALMNYHDGSNFRRAFKRWFNVSPNEYRQQFEKFR